MISSAVKTAAIRKIQYMTTGQIIFFWNTTFQVDGHPKCPRYVRLGICKAEFLRLLSRYKLIEIWLQLHRRVNVLYQRLHFGITIITVKFNGALFLNGGKNLVGIIVASKSQNEDKCRENSDFESRSWNRERLKSQVTKNLLLTISYRGTLVLIIYLTNY